MKKLLVSTVSSMMLFSAFSHANHQSTQIDFDKVQSEWVIENQRATILPSSSLYAGDFQSIAKQQQVKEMYAGGGSSMMITFRLSPF